MTDRNPFSEGMCVRLRADIAESPRYGDVTDAHRGAVTVRWDRKPWQDVHDVGTYHHTSLTQEDRPHASD